MDFWKKTKKIFSNFKRQGSDRIKIPSTQEICRSQSDYAIDSLKLYEKELELMKKTKKDHSRQNNVTIKQRPLSLFIDRNDGSDEEEEEEEMDSGCTTCENRSSSSVDSISSISSTSFFKFSSTKKEDLIPQLQIRLNSKVRWSEFSVSDLHNFLLILKKEEDATKSAIINRYKYLSKEISLRLKQMKT